MDGGQTACDIDLEWRQFLLKAAIDILIGLFALIIFKSDCFIYLYIPQFSMIIRKHSQLWKTQNIHHEIIKINYFYREKPVGYQTSVCA